MRSSERTSREGLRLVITLAGMLAAFLLLAGTLWRVQVVHAAQYRSRMDRQSMRRIRLPAVRGSIYDRNGNPLAGNRPSYCIAIYVEELRQPGLWKHTIDKVEQTIADLSRELGLEPEMTRDEIREHIYRRLPLPLLAWRDVSRETIARWAESPVTFPGVDIHVESVRVYPQGSLAAHLLGYVGRADPRAEERQPYHFYLPEMEGKNGIESYCDADLTGIPGGRLIRVDASGYRYEEEFEREPSAGADIRLAIDARVQRLAEEALQGVRGACVIINPRNGDVLALASAPAFDLGLFTPGISVADWNALRDNPNKPLFNRAAQGVYAPGSTFKPLVGIAAMENSRATPDTVYHCPGYFRLGDTVFRCWRRSGHGDLAMRKALEQSCNAYFCQLGIECGHERIFHMAEAVGFGRRTGLDLNAESPGLVPDGVGWRGGDTCNLSIGQGALGVTPVQMAVFAATLANGGTVYSPRLILGRGAEGHWRRNPSAGIVVNRMGWSPATLEAVRGGMLDVVHAENGTGKRVRLPGIRMAGKTGTAEYGPRTNRKKNAWMILFAPYENPLYAVAMVVEDAVSGGITVGPRLRRIMAGILGVSDPEDAHGEEGAG